MNALEREIRLLIESEGPLPVSRYMALCLGHPRYGYYMTRDPFGSAGDFVTAPEVSQMFGELLGIWCAEVWRAMGAPSPLHLVELGPGRGTLVADLLRAARTVPEFRAALELHLVETSPVLAERQRETLAGLGVGAQWHRDVGALPEGPLIAIANEFVDALPVDQWTRTETGWHERRIGLREGRLAFALDAEPLPDAVTHQFEHLRPALGAVIERRDPLPIRDVARHITSYGGAALIIDYGHSHTGFGDTFQAVRAHRATNPLQDPGEADLTAHVDFEQLAASTKRTGVRTLGPVTQGHFLRTLGIDLRAQNLKRGKDASTAALVDAAVARLASPAPGMGDLFKALALTHPMLPAPPGFDT